MAEAPVIRPMQAQWEEYRAMCYPRGCNPVQERECRQAFISGALCAIQTLNQIAELPEPECFDEVDKLHFEVITLLRKAVGGSN